MMKRKTLLLSVVLAVLLLVGCEPPRAPVAPAPCPSPGPCPRPAPRPKVKVLVFTASWCGPCQQAKPVLVQIKAAGMDVQIIDIDEQPALAQQYGITSLPTFIVLVDGKQVVRTQEVSVVVSWVCSRGR